VQNGENIRCVVRRASFYEMLVLVLTTTNNKGSSTIISFEGNYVVRVFCGYVEVRRFASYSNKLVVIRKESKRNARLKTRRISPITLNTSLYGPHQPTQQASASVRISSKMADPNRESFLQSIHNCLQYGYLFLLYLFLYSPVVLKFN
jgi:hypothetical protein